jgi:hypothetical protein
MDCGATFCVKRRDVQYKRVQAASSVRTIIIVLQVVGY